MTDAIAVQNNDKSSFELAHYLSTSSFSTFTAALAPRRVLKVIVETCFLTEEEKIAACKCVTEAGADFIKTSTGFGSKGATLEDIKLFKEHIGAGVQMKAAGGIHTREEMEGFIEAGCTRLGASAAVKVLKDEVDK